MVRNSSAVSTEQRYQPETLESEDRPWPRKRQIEVFSVDVEIARQPSMSIDSQRYDGLRMNHTQSTNFNIRRWISKAPSARKRVVFGQHALFPGQQDRSARFRGDARARRQVVLVARAASVFPIPGWMLEFAQAMEVWCQKRSRSQPKLAAEKVDTLSYAFFVASIPHSCAAVAETCFDKLQPPELHFYVGPT